MRGCQMQVQSTEAQSSDAGSSHPGISVVQLGTLIGAQR
jgi:hypothetical protein